MENEDESLNLPTVASFENAILNDNSVLDEALKRLIKELGSCEQNFAAHGTTPTGMQD